MSKNVLEFPFRFGSQARPSWPPIPRNPDGPYPSAIPEKDAPRRAAALTGEPRCADDGHASGMAEEVAGCDTTPTRVRMEPEERPRHGLVEFERAGLREPRQPDRGQHLADTRDDHRRVAADRVAADRGAGCLAHDRLSVAHDRDRRRRRRRGEAVERGMRRRQPEQRHIGIGIGIGNRATIDLLGDEFLEAVKTGDPVNILEDGTVEVG